MNETKKILVVDDEAQIIRVIKRILAAHHYEIHTAADGKSAFEIFKDWKPDLIVTDLQMPNMDGLKLCRKLRDLSKVPIIVLSVRNEEKTIVEALDAGADDYVTKPFGTNELLARIRAGLRRLPEKEANVIAAGDFYIDFSAHKVLINKSEVHLTPKELELLAFLVRNSDKVLTHTVLLQNVWGNYYTESPEALRVLIGSLRKKIEKDFSRPKYILTEPWIGYRFIPNS
jgi:two-component system KDP operon response regulator KdpE